MANENTPKSVIVYRNAAGKEPFTDWLNGLRNPSTRRRILKRLLRLEQGHYGDVKPVGTGVNELRFFFGAGYRVYFGEDGGYPRRSPLRRRQKQPAPRHPTGASLLAGVSNPCVITEP